MDGLGRAWQGLLHDRGRRSRWEDGVRTVEEQVHSFLQFDPDLARDDSAPEGLLAGVPFAVKDNIAVSRFRLTCGSRMLANLVSPYTATAVQRLQREGAVVVGKTNLDEFGMGSSTENSALLQTANPWDPDRVPGGSSGGSAAAVAAGLVPFALGSDTGGSIRQPAAFCGVYGLKPTYGAVSRYGLVAYASSLEVIGVIARDVATSREVFERMRGADERDHSSVESDPPAPRAADGCATSAGRVVGIPRECRAMAVHPDVQAAFADTERTLGELGYTLVEVELPTLQYAVAAYYVIATAEASANLARFDGVRYGQRAMDADTPEELMKRSRSRGLGDEVKLRILLGTYVLRSGFQEQYYLRAQRIRTAIRQDFERAFCRADLILMPVYTHPPFKRGGAELDPFAQKLADIYTSAANLAGIPAMSFPAALAGGLPIGMQFLAPSFGEERLFTACADFERVFPAPRPPLFAADGGR